MFIKMFLNGSIIRRLCSTFHFSTGGEELCEIFLRRETNWRCKVMEVKSFFDPQIFLLKHSKALIIFSIKLEMENFFFVCNKKRVKFKIEGMLALWLTHDS